VLGALTRNRDNGSAPNVALVRRMYDSGMAPEVTGEIMAADLIWDATPGFPHGGVYTAGRKWAETSSARSCPPRTPSAPAPSSSTPTTTTTWSCSVTTTPPPKGEQEVQVRFIHLWTIRDGKLARMLQAADSYILRHALNA
jgi:hypothetical protein